MRKGGKVVVMAGAGVSAGKPSSLPSWKPLNSAIVEVLRRRLAAYREEPEFLKGILQQVEIDRQTGSFPPEYQAQITHEMCGERYFHALQALNVDAFNAGHDGIAALAAAGKLEAVVTTNFDRLIEQACDLRKVKYEVAFDDEGYERLRGQLLAGTCDRLPIIKIHGCVSSATSMIDTLKQRNRGRGHQLESCLEALHPHYWVYYGFSAADLEGNPSYLGLIAGARRSVGATYIAFPGNPTLGVGARSLMAAYGDRGVIVVMDIAEQLRQVCGVLDVPGWDTQFSDTPLGEARFQQNLQAWAAQLSLSAAVLCLAAILEAIGQAEHAVRILDRFVRHELLAERETDDFHALQLHYGRLGAALGRFIMVSDLGGVAANAAIETIQSLARLRGTDAGFAAYTWMACTYLWLNQGNEALQIARELMRVFNGISDEGLAPRNDEEAIDGWLSAVQVFLVNPSPAVYAVVIDTLTTALQRATICGDTVREARVAALHLLVLAEVSEDVLSRDRDLDAVFAEARRVGDGFALGMRSLALGRYYTSPRGLLLAGTTNPELVATTALGHLTKAIAFFERQGMDPWIVYAKLQQIKAHLDSREFDDAQSCVQSVKRDCQRFPVFTAYLYEVCGQAARAQSDDARATANFQAAIAAAEQSGLIAKAELLSMYLL